MLRRLPTPLILSVVYLGMLAAGSSQTLVSDSDWKAQAVSLKDAREAEFVIRVGDVDNLGFGWPQGFNAFCERMTEAHPYPWTPNAADRPGLDRIIVSTAFKPNPADAQCVGDGYSSTLDPAPSRPVTYAIPADILKGAQVKNAYLQLFVDDFQAPSRCSKFQVTVNGSRFVEAEKILNTIDQSGPVGKLVTLKLPEEFHGVLAGGGALQLKIDEVTGAGDGFALDFIRLLVNRRNENLCRGDQAGRVEDKETGAPIAGARVSGADVPAVTTDSDGHFLLKGMSTGFEVVAASAAGYNDGSAVADIAQGADNADVTIQLAKGQGTAQFDGKDLKSGETITLNAILFDLNSAELRPASLVELDKIAAFLKSNAAAEIELSGHTSSEGDAALNRSLSYRRVKACKDYIVAKGIDTGRVTAVGYGPDRPVAPNDTEVNRAKNRRAEMRVLTL